MTSLGRASLRLAVYVLVLAWLAGDLFLFHGPLRKHLDRKNPTSEENIAAAKAGGVVARVFNRQITRGQLDRALHHRLWLEGKSPADLNPDQRRLALYAALDDLIDHELLRVKSKAHAHDLPVSEQEIAQRFDLWAQQFSSPSQMHRALQNEGIASESEMRERFAAQIQQEKYLEMRIAPLIDVTDEEARDWFEENRAQLSSPECVRVRHVFLSYLNREPAEAKNIMQPFMDELQTGGMSFESIARDVSEDPSSRSQGGDLGWMSRERLPEDFASAVFTLPLHQPSWVETKIGLHLVEITERRSAQPRKYNEARDEVIAALQTLKRDQALRDYRRALRNFETEKIEVFHDMLRD
ncbi:MAG: peptidylprolyl isomerase [Luteolibacter sp.]